jgi:hypothetical protein
VPQLGFLFGFFPPQAFHVLGWIKDLAISPAPVAMLGELISFLVPSNLSVGWDPMYLNLFPSCLCLLKLFLNTGNEWGLIPNFFDDEILVIMLLESENVLKLQPCISLIQVRDSEMAMASEVNMEEICDIL